MTNLCFAFIVACCSLSTINSESVSEQPDCAYNSKANEFFKFFSGSRKPYSKHKNNYYEDEEEDEEDDDRSKNWICELTYANKLKLCVGIYRTLVKRKFDTKYTIKDEKNKALVDTECVTRKVSFWRHISDSSDTAASAEKATTKGNKLVTLDVEMFKCPVSMLDIEFKWSWKIFPPKRYDFYLTQGTRRGSLFLLNDSPKKENFCVKNTFRPKSKS